MRNTTLAIIGTHPDTRALAPWDDPTVDRWVLNEAAAADWCGPVDAVLQIHDPVIYRNPRNRCDPGHWEWLQQPHPCPVYMQAVDPQVPSSTRYPLDEICAALLPGFSWDNGAPIRYFTNSIAYALALGIYLDYARILVYGTEMTSSTEYRDQRDCVAFWTGLALGRGVEVVQFSGRQLYDVPLYGYEGNAFMQVEHFTADLPGIEVKVNEKRQEFNAAQEADNRLMQAASPEFPAARARLLELARELGMLGGIVEEKRRYAEKTQAMIDAAGGAIYSRNEFEARMANLRQNADKYRIMSTYESGAASALWTLAEAGDERARAEFASLSQRQVDAAYTAGLEAGRASANEAYMMHMTKSVRMAGGDKAVEACRVSLTHQPA